MILSKLLGQRGLTPEKLYSAIVAQSRQTYFFTDLGIKDDVNGRFDMICLHMVLVLTRLTGAREQQSRFDQYLIDLFFADMDRCLRELGVGDLSVGKKVRKMSEVFYGLGHVMHPILTGVEVDERPSLEEVLNRNFYESENDEMAQKLARYTTTQFAHLSEIDVADIEAGTLRFVQPGPDA